MPPSAGACQTTSALFSPDCGRAGPRSSIITAIACRFAIFSGTRLPVSGAGTSRAGSGVGTDGIVGTGVGVGEGVGDGVGAGVGEGVGVGIAATGDGDAGWPEAGDSVAAATPSRR